MIFVQLVFACSFNPLTVKMEFLERFREDSLRIQPRKIVIVVVVIVVNKEQDRVCATVRRQVEKAK